MNKLSEIPMETLKATPSITAGTLYFFGIPISEWLVLCIIAYYVALTFFLIRDKWWRQRRKRK